MEPRATDRIPGTCLRTFRDRDQPRPEGRAFLLLGFLSWILRSDGDLSECSQTERTVPEIRSVEPRATGSDLRHGSLCLRTFRDRDQPRPEGRAFLLLGFPSWILRPGTGILSRNVRKQRERARRSDRWSRAPPDRTSGTVLSVCGRFGIEISLVPKGELSYVQDGDLGFPSWILRPGTGSALS